MTRIAFTREELIEVTRALSLMSEQDNDADVNVDPPAVAAKASALRKLQRAQRRGVRQATVARLIARGFDLTAMPDDRGDDYISPRCSRCEALVISGVACHEAGCPNEGRDAND